MKEISFKEFVSFLRARWFIFMAVLLVSLIAGGLYSYIYVKPMYESDTTIILRKSSNPGTQNDVQINTQLVANSYQILTSRAVTQGIVDDLHLSMSAKTLSQMIQVQSAPSTAVMTITVHNADPALAAKIADSAVSVFKREFEKIYATQIVNVLTTAKPASAPYNIAHTRDMSVAAVAGVMLGLTLLFAAYMMDFTIRSEEDIENSLKLPVLASVPDIMPAKTRKAAAE